MASKCKFAASPTLVSGLLTGTATASHLTSLSIPHPSLRSTVGGLQTLSEWLQARMFLTNFRPVPLTEHVVFQGTVYMKVIWIGEGRWHTSYSSPLHWHPGNIGGECSAFCVIFWVQVHGNVDVDSPLVRLRTLDRRFDRRSDPDGIAALVAEVREFGWVGVAH